MAEIVNLRRARKAKLRAESDRQAAENRIVFGRSKAERIQAASTESRAARHIEGHRIAPIPRPDPDEG